MTTATFLWEGDEEPAALIRLEGDGPGPVDAEVRDALEAEVPRFQDLIALELGVTRSGPRWSAHWLLVSRAHEDRLHQYPQGWDLLAAGLAPQAQGTVVVAPEDEVPWLVATKDKGRVTAVRRVAAEELRTAGEAPFLLVLPESAAGRAEQWKETGLAARVLSRAALVTPALKARLARQLDQAAGQEFAVLRLEAPRSKSLPLVAALAVLVAANVLLLGDPAPEEPPAEPVAFEAPRPSVVLAALAAAVPGLDLREFRMTGASWRLDLHTDRGVAALEALKKRVPGLRVVQFQVASGGTRLMVEGEGYP